MQPIQGFTLSDFTTIALFAGMIGVGIGFALGWLNGRLHEIGKDAKRVSKLESSKKESFEEEV